MGEVVDSSTPEQRAVSVLAMEDSLSCGDCTSIHQQIPEFSGPAANWDAEGFEAESECFLLCPESRHHMLLDVEGACPDLRSEAVGVLSAVVLRQIGEKRPLQGSACQSLPDLRH